MALDPQLILDHDFGEIRHSYVERDAILYALGLGLGSDPLDEADLAHLLETRLKVLPTFAVTLASPGMWVREPALGIDWVRLVHSAQSAHFFGSLPPRGEIVGSARVTKLADRGAGRGAVLEIERTIRDAISGEIYCVLQQTLLLRGDGGYGGSAPEPEAAPTRPDRAPDHRFSIATSPRAALIYRLSGDWNPLHADPVIARAAGFDRPILQGLASYGMASLAVCRVANIAPSGLRALDLRFSNIVTPGERLDFDLWREGARMHFEAKVNDKIVLSKGLAELGEAE